MAQSENLLPFVLDAHCARVAIPALRDDDGAWRIYDESEIRRMGFIETAQRFRAVNRRLKNVGKGLPPPRAHRRKAKIDKAGSWKKRLSHSPGAGGKHICDACVPFTGGTDLVVDQTLYWQVIPDEDEAWYRVGMLGSQAMTEAITPFNPKGGFGERHIMRCPTG